jgi:putative membrane protein
MKGLTVVVASSLAVAFAAPVFARSHHRHSMAGSEGVASGATSSTSASESKEGGPLAAFLNKANEINTDEQKMAKMARSKAGDNQAMMTFAETLKADHKANEEALTALARQKKIKLESAATDKEAEDRLSKLKGGDFNAAFLEQEIKGHKEAMRTLQSAKDQNSGDRDAQLYISQTLPIVEAHLKMAESLQKEMNRGSTQNPENNRSGKSEGLTESAKKKVSSY